MNIIEIDLENESTENGVMRLIGRKLAFADWVRYNWNAFEETIRCLDTGDNYQSNIKYEFPLTLVFKNTNNFKENEPESYQILQDILENAVKEYKEFSGLKFKYILN